MLISGTIIIIVIIIIITIIIIILYPRVYNARGLKQKG